MKQDLREYAKVGLAQFMLWPQCVQDGKVLADSLESIVRRMDIEMFDCCLPFGDEARAQLIPLVRDCGKHVHCAVHLFPLDKISLGSTADNEKGLIRLAMIDQLDVLAAVHPVAATFASGLDPGDVERPAAQRAFDEFCRWFCGELAERNINALLEPFDRAFDRKFLYGPTSETVELIESLAPGVQNLSIQLDIAHVRLQGETFEHAIRASAPHLGHVHLGNCVKRDRLDPYFGDRHPPIGYPGGEIDVPELIEVLRLLLDVGYLQRDHRNSLAIEARPLSPDGVEHTIQDQFRRVEEAWRRV